MNGIKVEVTNTTWRSWEGYGIRGKFWKVSRNFPNPEFQKKEKSIGQMKIPVHLLDTKVGTRIEDKILCVLN